MIKQRCKSYMYLCLTFVNGSIVLAIVLTIDTHDHNHIHSVYDNKASNIGQHVSWESKGTPPYATPPPRK